MRALISGGAGFLGSHLVDRLAEAGHEVVVLDNFITGRETNLSRWEGSGQIQLVRQDVTDYIDMEGPLDAVFHFASPASPLDFDRFPIQVLKAGALGTHKTLGLAKHKGARYLLASTSEVYGDPLVNPQPESYWGNVNPIGPRGVYDEAKRYAEAMTMAYRRVHGVDTRIARIFNTYGPRMRLDDGRVVPSFVRQLLQGEPLTIYGDGSQTRCFTYVDDTVQQILDLFHSSCSDPVNIGSDEERTICELADAIEAAWGGPAHREFRPLPQDDPKRRKPDLTRNRSTLPHRTPVPLDAGLRRTLDFFRAIT